MVWADDPPNVLDLPRIMSAQNADNQQSVQLLQAGAFQEARHLLEKAAVRVPYDFVALHNLACAQALLDDSKAALETLKIAVERGYRSHEMLEKDPDLAAVRKLPEFSELLLASKKPPPKEAPGWKYSVGMAQPEGAMVLIDSHNANWNPSSNCLQVIVNLTRAGKQMPITGSGDSVGKLLNEWHSDGSAAGNVGDLYDNHDRAHSPLPMNLYPQMTQIIYGPQAKHREMDNGLQRFFLFIRADSQGTLDAEQIKSKPVSSEATAEQFKLGRAVVLGNSSTALTGDLSWRSMPRLALTIPGGAQFLQLQYANNHIYVYPEHRDHDPVGADGSGFGDVFFANTPYYLISQGSSGTDQDFLRAIATTMAAFHPDVKTWLRENGLVAPTVQMIFRRCNRSVQTDEDYLKPIAHPTVFESSQIDNERMVKMAHAMKLKELPPLVQLKVVSEKQNDHRLHYFDSASSENLLTTPAAIARLCKSTEYWREMIVSAEDSKDFHGNALEFHWRVLRGDPERIQIESVDGSPTARRIRVGYQLRRLIATGSAIDSSRVDIGVFAHNGYHYSAPAFISFQFPDNEVRRYDEKKRILSVDYNVNSHKYVDPWIFCRRDWRDDYRYDDDGKLTGWTRLRATGSEEFDSSGNRVIFGEDRPRQVRYERVTLPNQITTIKQITAD